MEKTIKNYWIDDIIIFSIGRETVKIEVEDSEDWLTYIYVPIHLWRWLPVKASKSAFMRSLTNEAYEKLGVYLYEGDAIVSDIANEVFGEIEKRPKKEKLNLTKIEVSRFIPNPADICIDLFFEFHFCTFVANERVWFKIENLKTTEKEKLKKQILRHLIDNGVGCLIPRHSLADEVSKEVERAISVGEI